jgi:AcrR family transcriptional regulator
MRGVSTQTRKQREIQQREGHILDAARKILLERGYLGLTMDRIAQAIDYSKGTVYQHFTSKEDVIAAVTIQTFETRIYLIERAATFSGRPRERMVALGEADELFFRLYPDYLRAQQIIRIGSLLAKTSDERLATIQAQRSRMLGIATGVIRDGVAQGDLNLPPGMTAEEMAFGLFSLVLGGRTLTGSRSELSVLGMVDPFRTIRQTTFLLLDGFGWRPLTTEWDYERTLRRVRQEVFPQEVQRARTADA